MSEQPPKTIVTKMRENLAYLRSKGASRERIQQEIDRWKAELDTVSASERELSPAENIAAMGSTMASGATFGMFDELAGLFGGEDAKDTQRFLKKQFAEENPGEALTLEVMGGLAVPGSLLRQAPRAAPFAAKALRVAGEGAAQGGLAGFGNAEGDVMDRIGATTSGATAGAVASGAIAGVGKGIARVGRNVLDRFGVSAPNAARTMETMADRLPDEDIATARENLARLRGRVLSDEATVADVLPQGEGALRQAATENREVRKSVDKALRQRSNRLANRADDRFSLHTGTQRQSGRKSIEQLNEEASERARPHYAAAAREAADAPPVQRISAADRNALAALGVAADKLPPSDAIDEALALPYVQQRMAALRSAPRSRFASVADDDHGMLDQVYKDIGKQIRSLPRDQWSLKEDLIHQRAILADAITSRAPSYRTALSEFADPMARKDAFTAGATPTPADMVPSEMKGMDAAETASYKEGIASRLRRDVPTLELGEYARFADVLAPVANREKAETFKAAFGEPAFKEYVTDLVEMAGLQRMKAGAGESTTVDKILEQLQTEPEAIVSTFAQMLRGNPMAAVAQFAPTNAVGRTLDRLRNSKSAQQRSDFLLQQGDDKVSAALDLLERLRREGKLPRRTDWRDIDVSRAGARQAGAVAGRP